MQKCLKSALFLRADLEECQFGFIKKPHLCFCIEVYEKTTLLLTWAMPSDAFLMSLWTLRNPIKVLFNTEGLLLCKNHTFLFDIGLVGPAPTSVRWTCLMLDLQLTLSDYLSRSYSHLKNIKLCANMTVKNMFTSDLLLDPGEGKTFKQWTSYCTCIYFICAVSCLTAVFRLKWPDQVMKKKTGQCFSVSLNRKLQNQTIQRAKMMKYSCTQTHMLKLLKSLTQSLLIHCYYLLTGVSFSQAKLMGLTSSQGTGAIPREMSFPVPKGGSWHDLYDYIRYSYRYSV